MAKMIDYIKKILEINNYKPDDKYQDINFFAWKWEYFMIWEYDTRKINNFFESDVTRKIVTDFKYIKKIEADIEKNTSLIILLKTGKLSSVFNNLKNQIMIIEEDEYFFRKYVIIYDEDWEEFFKSNYKNIEELSNKKLEDDLKNIVLKDFRADSFKNSKDYLLMQLFIKLPFLNVEYEKKGKNEIWTLMNKIEEQITIQKLNDLNNYVLNEDFLEQSKKWSIWFKYFSENISDLDDKNIDSFLNDLIKKNNIWK